MKKLCLITILFSLCRLSSSQTFSNQKEIVNTGNLTPILISKGRNLPLNKQYEPIMPTLQGKEQPISNTGNWGASFHFFSGYGIFSKEPKKDYSNNVPIGLGLDFYYRNIVLYLTFYNGFGFTQHDFTDKSVVWDKNSTVVVAFPEASLGYIINDNEFFDLSPFVGYSTIYISPTSSDIEEDPGLKDYELTIPTFTIGFNGDLKFGEPNFNIVTTDGREQSNFIMRIRYTYNFRQFSKLHAGFDWGMHCITIGFGVLGRKI